MRETKTLSQRPEPGLSLTEQRGLFLARHWRIALQLITNAHLGAELNHKSQIIRSHRPLVRLLLTSLARSTAPARSLNHSLSSSFESDIFFVPYSRFSEPWRYCAKQIEKGNKSEKSFFFRVASTQDFARSSERNE